MHTHKATTTAAAASPPYYRYIVVLRVCRIVLAADGPITIKGARGRCSFGPAREILCLCLSLALSIKFLGNRLVSRARARYCSVCSKLPRAFLLFFSHSHAGLPRRSLVTHNDTTDLAARSIQIYTPKTMKFHALSPFFFVYTAVIIIWRDASAFTTIRE